MKIEDTLKSLKRSIQNGTISSATKKELEEFASALCGSQSYTYFSERQFPQICELVRLQLLRCYIDGAEKRASKYQWIIVGIAVVSVAATIIGLL